MIAQKLPARHGLLWVMAAWQLLRRYPRQLTSMTMLYFLIVLLVNLLPYIGPFLLPLALPSLTVMMANACRTLDGGRVVTQEQLIHGIKAQRMHLLRLGGLHLLGSVVLLLVSQPLMQQLDPGQAKNAADFSGTGFHLILLLLIASPILMAFWFAPLLTAWHGLHAVKALFFSFVASWRNMSAFLVYGLVVTGVGVLLPGLLVVIGGLIFPQLVGVLAIMVQMALVMLIGPVLVASIYISYRDVFVASGEVNDALSANGSPNPPAGY
jgi:hypothetical protein